MSSWSTYNSGSPNSYHYSDSWSWAHSSSWSRGADVSTRSGTVSAGDMCASNATYSDWYTYSSYYAQQSSSQGSARDEASRCGIEAASDAAGVPADAFVGQSCASSEHTSSRTQSGTSWNASTEQSSSSNVCLQGARAGAAGESASVGAGNACGTSSFRHDPPSGNSYQDDYARCRTGVFASGPDGIVLFVGYEEGSWAWCDGDYCEGDAFQSLGASLDWQHSPLGPDGTDLWYTLPLP